VQHTVEVIDRVQKWVDRNGWKVDLYYHSSW
jgi:hypothetical protein